MSRGIHLALIPPVSLLTSSSSPGVSWVLLARKMEGKDHFQLVGVGTPGGDLRQGRYKVSWTTTT
jgi:hypothetical protein